MGWMDKAAGIAAFRHAGTPAVVTAAVDKLEFRVPIHQGQLVELLAHVESQGRTSMVVRVEVHREDPVTRSRELCTVGTFTMVAVDEEGLPTPVRGPLSWLERVSGGYAASESALARPSSRGPAAAARVSGWRTVSATTIAATHEAGADQERQVVAAGQRRRPCDSPSADQVVGARRRQRRQHRQAERAADLRGRVDQARGEAGVARRGARHRERHQRRERRRRRRCRAGPSPAARRSRSCRRPARGVNSDEPDARSAPGRGAASCARRSA